MTTRSTNDYNESTLLGMDRTPRPGQSSAYLARNVRYDGRSGSWCADRGYQFWLNNADSDLYRDTLWLGKHSLHQDSEVHYLCEQLAFSGLEPRNGTLTLKAITESDQSSFELQAGRYLPDPRHPGTQISQYGRVSLIQNGVDDPLKYYRTNEIAPWGFRQRPSPPKVYSPDNLGESVLTAGTPPIIKFVGSQIETRKFYTIGWLADNNVGLGDPTDESTSSYSYRVSFVSDTGSEGPLSTPSNSASWVADESGGIKNGLQLTGVPTGPKGTVARRLYRTRNMRDGVSRQGTAYQTSADDADYYFCDQINDNYTTHYTDQIPDSQLGSLAPSELDSTIYPEGVLYCVAYQGRMIVAGGTAYPTRVWLSKPGRPEQYGALDFFELGDAIGGQITGLKAFNGQIYIFREKSIHAMVTEPRDPRGFRIVTVSTDTGCEAPNSIKEVPSLGLVWCGTDGIYALRGNYQGGGQVQVARISDQLDDQWMRVNVRALPRACAVYNEKDQEYWVQVPADGKDFGTLGFVLHSNGLWSLRENIYAQCLFVGREGRTLLGGSLAYEASVLTQNPRKFLTGIGVWSGTRSMGFPLDAINFEYAPPFSEDCAQWVSGWLDMGDWTKQKIVTGIELHLLTSSGKGEIEVAVWRDDAPLTEDTAYQIIDVPTTRSQSYIEPAYYNDNSGQEGRLWTRPKLIATSVDLKKTNLNKFRFRIQSSKSLFIYDNKVAEEGEMFIEDARTTRWKILGYTLRYEVDGQQRTLSKRVTGNPYQGFKDGRVGGNQQ